MIFISFLIGGVAGALTMAICAGNAYEKGREDAKRLDRNSPN